jgi:hypothetical protein
MPIPSRKDNEDKNKFMSRCMSNETMKKEYTNIDQRTAICMSKATEFCDKIEAADFEYNINNFGYEEEIDEDNFYIPTEAEYVDFGEETEEWDVSIAKPGLWENIRKKKEREGKNYKPAKKGDPDRPDPKAWKKAQSSDSEMSTEQLQKMHDQLMSVVSKIKLMEIEFEEWTKDMISKAEIYIQNIFDFVTYYKPEEEEEDETEASEYQGRKVQLNKPFRTPDGPKKMSVYVKNDKGNVVKVNFGDPNMKIKKSDPARRKSFRARHNCENPGPKWKARYWSCRAW